MKPKVLHVIKSLHLGGAETNLRNLLTVFDRSRFEHHVAYAAGGELEAEFQALPDVRLFRYSSVAARMSSPRSAWIVRRLWAYLRRNGIRIVHTHTFNGHFWGVFAAKLAGARVVEHVHDFRYIEPEEVARRHGYSNLSRYIGVFQGLSDRVLVLTAQNEEFLLKKGAYPRSKIRRSYNGVPPFRAVDRAAARRRLGLGADDPVVLTAARLAGEKNLGVVLKTAEKLKARVPAAVFLIAGSGPLLESARAQAPANVRFLGFQPGMPDLLAAADVFFLPSFLELHSIALLEAMSAGLPAVISSGVGCHEEFIVDWENGVLLDPFCEAGWAEAVERLLGDEPLRRRIGENAKALCGERFSLASAARRIESIYEELL
ncbi:MAG TPA: glycosyltransferase family 4 protein [Candidatus Eisenbacteria bacterium]|nr:glycosyltransferase family 4 protein [Candidatus Eisenbacteria bacterium]